MEGVILKAMSGFYYVRSGSDTYSCRARGRFRLDGSTPLVGDRVSFSVNADGSGTVTELLPRNNFFLRPAVANLDALVMIVSAAIPITDPFLIDRLAVRCEKNDCPFMIVINKCDLDPADKLTEIYQKTPYPCLRVSAKTGQGMRELQNAIRGKCCCFTGNSGVGKSSLLNAIDPRFSIETADVSYKLGRGKHTTRHVEFFDLGDNTLIADTPGFASLEETGTDPIRKQELAGLFPEFAPYLDGCRFLDCAHINEPDCSVRQAVDDGVIHQSRYHSYKRLYDEAAQYKDWELS